MKESPIDEDEGKYFDEDSLIENEYYKGIHNLIICTICNQIFKEPMMCNKCQKTFCKKCLNEVDKENHQCENPEYMESINANNLLLNLKYLCKNCKKEIRKGDIEAHLKENCIKNENPDKLMDSIFRKYSLRKLTNDEIKEIPKHKKNVNHITGKLLKYIKFLL